MIGLIGIVVLFLTVFGGYTLSGGKLGVILHALPFEMLIILGAAIGAFLLSNGLEASKHTAKDIIKAFAAPKWATKDYKDVLCVLYELIKLSKDNPVLLEQHIDDTANSDIFIKYPKIQADSFAIELICDTLRAATLQFDDPIQVEDILSKRLEDYSIHSCHSSHRLTVVADGLPALGIVAAVLGVIKTMSSIDQPPDVLGKMIGGALVGTFLGVFISYGLIYPIANKMKDMSNDSMAFYRIIKEVLIASLYNNSAGVCVEVGRQIAPQHLRPDFEEIDLKIKGMRNGV